MTSKYYVQKEYRTNPLSLMGFPNEVKRANRIYDSIKDTEAYFTALRREELNANNEFEAKFERDQMEAEAFSITPNPDDLSESEKLCLIHKYKNRNNTEEEDDKKEKYDYESEWHDEMYRRSKRKKKKL
jgi:hypothetical protein